MKEQKKIITPSPEIPHSKFPSPPHDAANGKTALYNYREKRKKKFRTSINATNGPRAATVSPPIVRQPKWSGLVAVIVRLGAPYEKRRPCRGRMTM